MFEFMPDEIVVVKNSTDAYYKFVRVLYVADVTDGRIAAYAVSPIFSRRDVIVHMMEVNIYNLHKLSAEDHEEYVILKLRTDVDYHPGIFYD